MHTDRHAKLLIRPVPLMTDYATITGFEVMRALCKVRTGAFGIQTGILGEARILGRAFGVDPTALTEATSLLQDHLAAAEA